MSTNEKNVVYFSVNNWFCGRDYPDTKNFRKWLGNDLKQNFMNDEWCKENKLCHFPLPHSQQQISQCPFRSRFQVQIPCP